MSRLSRRAVERERRARHRRERRLIRDLLPPEGVPLTFEIASLGARIAAQCVDLLATGLLAIAAVALVALTELVSPAALELIGWLLFLLIRAPYYIAAELAWNGQTLGKRLRRLRVVSADGRSLRPYAIAVRNIMKELEVFVPGTMLLMAPVLSPLENAVLLVWIAILLAVPLANGRRQRLGDMIAGTYVIRQPQAVLMPDVAARVEAGARFAFLPHQLDHYGAFEVQTLEAVLHAGGRSLDPASARRHRQKLRTIAERIRAKIDYVEPVGDADVPAFLEAFYLAQRRYLEGRKLFGDARADKYHADDRKRALWGGGS
jgi:uncharacterized RDD family membrane protein YckC